MMRKKHFLKTGVQKSRETARILCDKILMRRYGTIKPGQTYIDRAGVYAVIVSGRSLLVTEEQSDVNEFQLPGGGVDPGESLLQTLHREVREETGWVVAPIHKLSVYQRFTYMPDYDRWARKICHIFLCRPVLQKSPPTEIHHTEVWMSKSDAVSLLASPGDADVVARLRL